MGHTAGEKASQEERTMSSKIDPEAAQPTTKQDFELNDRNPAVMNWGNEGGLVESPLGAESRVAQEGPAISPNTGLKY
jgi:hypothetical protein